MRITSLLAGSLFALTGCATPPGEPAASRAALDVDLAPITAGPTVYPPAPAEWGFFSPNSIQRPTPPATPPDCTWWDTSGTVSRPGHLVLSSCPLMCGDLNLDVCAPDDLTGLDGYCMDGDIVMACWPVCPAIAEMMNKLFDATTKDAAQNVSSPVISP